MVLKGLSSAMTAAFAAGLAVTILSASQAMIGL